MARRKGLTFYQKKKRLDPRLLKDGVELLVGSAVAVFLAFVLVFSVGMRTSVIGDSMEPVLYNGQEILMNRILYKISMPKRGDVIVFLPNGNQNSHFYVKRVVGLPGETVQIRDGNVYIDGLMLAEDERFDKIVDPASRRMKLFWPLMNFLCLETIETAVRTAVPVISARSKRTRSSARRGFIWQLERRPWV